MSATRVSILFRLRGPAAIAWLVIAIRVNALDRVFWGRLFTHIQQKGLEVSPAFTNRDSAPAIQRIADLRRVFTSLNHRMPATILRRIGHAVSGACFEGQATAGLNVAPSQVSRRRSGYFPAVTAAFPNAVIRLYVNKTENCKRMETLTRKITGDRFSPHQLFSLIVDSWCRAAGRLERRSGFIIPHEWSY